MIIFVILGIVIILGGALFMSLDDHYCTLELDLSIERSKTFGELYKERRKTPADTRKILELEHRMDVINDAAIWLDNNRYYPHQWYKFRTGKDLIKYHG